MHLSCIFDQCGRIKNVCTEQYITSIFIKTFAINLFMLWNQCNIWFLHRYRGRITDEYPRSLVIFTALTVITEELNPKRSNIQMVHMPRLLLCTL